MSESNQPKELVLWRFHWDCGRRGEVNGIFTATREEIESAIGKEVYFGEILGKHSEVFGKLEKADILELTSDQDFIEKAIKYECVPSGYNPLDNIEENQD